MPPKPRVAARMADIAPFHVVELLTRAQAIEAAGGSVIHMEVGEPDFPTPAPMLAAAQAFLRQGEVRYTPSLGLPQLREAIAAFYATRYGVRLGPERIAVTAGASAALLLATGVLIDPGDEVLLTDPGYPCNRHFVRAFEGVPRAIAVGADTAYQPTAAMVDAAWGPHTRALLVASPSNPTGTLLDRKALAALHAITRRRTGGLIVDEIYHGLTYGLDATTVLADADDAFVVGSFSKYFGMTGWRLGWLVVPDGYQRDVEKLAQNLFISPSAPAQHAALAAFAPDTIALLEERRGEFARRRKLLIAGLSALGFGIGAEPRGAFYVYADVSRHTGDSYGFAWDMLEQAGVAATPGIDFGSHLPQRHMRFAYTNNEARLAAGLDRMQAFLKQG